MNDLFSDYEYEIREVELLGDYVQQEKKAKEFLSILYENRYRYPELTKEYLGFAHYALARAMYKTTPRNHYKYIIENIEKSLQYTEGIISESVSKSCWLLAVTYKKVYGSEKSFECVKLFKRATIYYRTKNKDSHKKCLADLLNNISNITHGIDEMKESIKIYEDLYKRKKVSKFELDDIYESAYYNFRYNNLVFQSNCYKLKITDTTILNDIETYENQTITA